mgnify:CR=1 FL=1
MGDVIMAERPVYVSTENAPYVKTENIAFQFFNGFSDVQKMRSIESLHAAFLAKNLDLRLLEISSKSAVPLGIELSAFNLQIVLPKSGKSVSVESAFQSSKVFEGGKQFVDLLDKSSRDAKRDPRLKTSGQLKAFKFFKHEFPLEPKTYFYDWLYINALRRQKDLTEEILNYDAFTDIEFNPKKSLNCQAKAAAIFVGLSRAGLIDDAVSNKEKFLEIVY